MCNLSRALIQTRELESRMENRELKKKNVPGPDDDEKGTYR